MTDTPFWERPLAELDAAQWEALCDGCGRCCLIKVEDADTGIVHGTRLACDALDLSTSRCSCYAERFRWIPDCINITLESLPELPWLPRTCAYRLRYQGEPLPPWHPLLTGEADSAVTAGVAACHFAIHESALTDPDAIGDHLLEGEL